eukprot:SAG22_NODE_560_length_9102_cov_54.310785_8_plen_251_part_00
MDISWPCSGPACHAVQRTGHGRAAQAGADTLAVAGSGSSNSSGGGGDGAAGAGAAAVDSEGDDGDQALWLLLRKWRQASNRPVVEVAELRPVVEVAELWTYPIKSCAGIQLPVAAVGRAWLQWDRCFAIATPDGQVRSQSQHPKLAQICPSLSFRKDNCVLPWARGSWVPVRKPAAGAGAGAGAGESAHRAATDGRPARRRGCSGAQAARPAAVADSPRAASVRGCADRLGLLRPDVGGVQRRRGGGAAR